MSNAKLSNICQTHFCEVLFEVYFFIDSTSFKIKIQTNALISTQTHEIMLPLLTVVFDGEREIRENNKETVSKSKDFDKNANVRSHPALHVSCKFLIVT